MIHFFRMYPDGRNFFPILINTFSLVNRVSSRSESRDSGVELASLSGLRTHGLGPTASLENSKLHVSPKTLTSIPSLAELPCPYIESSIWKCHKCAINA